MQGEETFSRCWISIWWKASQLKKKKKARCPLHDHSWREKQKLSSQHFPPPVCIKTTNPAFAFFYCWFTGTWDTIKVCTYRLRREKFPVKWTRWAAERDSWSGGLQRCCTCSQRSPTEEGILCTQLVPPSIARWSSPNPVFPLRVAFGLDAQLRITDRRSAGGNLHRCRR